VQRIETAPSGEKVTRTETHHVILLPRELEAEGRIETETRSRGIFDVSVYTLNVLLKGEFGPPVFAELGIDPAHVEWGRAHLAVGISDVRAIREQAVLTFNDKKAPFNPGTAGFVEGGSGIHAFIGPEAAKSGFRFSFPLALNGSVSVYLAPFGEQTTLRLTSNSSYPNFQGNWLPADRTVTADGFEALWRVSYLGRNYAQKWLSGADMRKTIDASKFGVELITPIDHYRMAERSVKYAGLFILLTFATIWLIEVLANVRVHPIQYLMLGAALCVFYLLELSLSEHIDFSIAYATASLSVIAMIAAYSRVIFGRERRSTIVTAGVTALYGYLFVVLMNEDAALLVGAIGLFVILAFIMYVTRHIDWYGHRKEEKTEHTAA
jgi:inner membrane protein